MSHRRQHVLVGGSVKLTRLRLAAALVVTIVAVLAVEAGGGGAQLSRASAATISPQTAIDWNLIAVTTVRAAAPAKFQIEGNLYMSYVQAAVYDAVTTIKGRYLPYHALTLKDPGASPRAAVAAAAYTTLSYYFPAQAASLTTTYTDYMNVTLAALPAAAKQAGVAVGAAAAADLIATRWGDGRDAPVGTPFGVAPKLQARGCLLRCHRCSRLRHRGLDRCARSSSRARRSSGLPLHQPCRAPSMRQHSMK